VTTVLGERTIAGLSSGEDAIGNDCQLIAPPEWGEKALLFGFLWNTKSVR
jgi:hypothetical protein